MTSSGTNTFTLNGGSLLLESFDRCSIRPVEITREMMSSAIRSVNLELASWSNNPAMLWKVEIVTFTLIQGTATYVFDQSVQLVLDGYVTLVQSGSDPIDRILVSVGRDEYAAYPDKEIQDAQSVFWFQRDITPQVTLWPVPDGQSETTVSFYVMKRVQDVTSTGSQTLDIPYRHLDALCARVAARLALKYNEKKFTLLKAEADSAYMLASTEDQERVALRVIPDFGIYQP